MAQPEQAQAETVRLMLDAHAQACLAALEESGQAPQPEAVLRTAGGWTLLVIASPTQPAGQPLGLTACDRDCLSLLAQTQEPLSGVRVHQQLEKRGDLHGLITVKRSLAKLKQLRLVSNSRTAPRGYYLPEKLPLFQHLLTRRGDDTDPDTGHQYTLSQQ
jgi:hypothetical protein